MSVASNYKSHHHTWQRTVRRQCGAEFHLHICTDHRDAEGKPAPVVKAYDMKVINAGAFRGPSEFLNKSHRH